MRNFRFLSASLCFMLCLITAPAAHAIPIQLLVTFTVDTILPPPDVDLDRLLTPPRIGSKFFASISVDNAMLATDGLLKAGKVLGFNAHIGQQIWNPALPNHLPPNSPLFPLVTDFAGFRGPCYNTVGDDCAGHEQEWGLGSEFLGFTVINGIVTHLHGGVFGTGDQTFIDFFAGDFPDQRFNANAWFFDPLASTPADLHVLIGLQGPFSISRIAEPATLALLCIGIAGLMAMSRRRMKQVSVRS